jgi:hypothetical protein
MLNNPRLTMKLLLSLAFLFLLSGVCGASATDWLIVPGTRVGAITKKSTLQDLRQIYGQENIKVTKIEVGEGFEKPGVIVFPNSSEKRLEIIWDKRQKPEVVVLRGEKSMWHTEEGITLGTSLKELEKLNRGKFTLMGFGWDYGGAVVSWNKGAIEKKYNKYPHFLLGMSLAPSTTNYDSCVDGDREFSSQHPGMQKINPQIYEISVSFK